MKVQGFYVAPGGDAEIKTINFPLTNKLITAIRKFPGSKIKVSGHTDATDSVQDKSGAFEKQGEKCC